MRLLAILKSLLAICLTIGLLALSSTSGHSATGPSASVVITSISGYDGHAFVFAQVTTPNSVSPAPTGTTHQSPYYAEWARVAIGSTTCPWVWAVYVFNRTTNLQVNPTPPNAPSPDFGTTTLVCASPGSTPVDEAPVAEATARLDLDLLVNVSPAVVAVGSSSLISLSDERLDLLGLTVVLHGMFHRGDDRQATIDNLKPLFDFCPILF